MYGCVKSACICCTVFNFVLIWCGWQCSDNHTQVFAVHLYGLECQFRLCIIFTVTGFWDHPWMLRISLVTGRISFATTSGDLCETDGLALNCLVIWDHSSSRSSWHSTRPGRSWNHVNIAVLIGLSSSVMQVMIAVEFMLWWFDV